MTSGSYTLKMLVKACIRLACPPKTEAPSVNELVEAETGSL